MKFFIFLKCIFTVINSAASINMTYEKLTQGHVNYINDNRIDLWSQDITYIDQNTFYNLNDTETLDLSHNYLVDQIHPVTFIWLSHLKELNLGKFYFRIVLNNLFDLLLIFKKVTTVSQA